MNRRQSISIIRKWWGGWGVIISFAFLVSGCGRKEYDLSTPQATLDSIYEMVHEGDGKGLSQVLYIQAREITYADGVTEASAIHEVVDKVGDMLGRLYRTAKKIRDHYPDEIDNELVKVGENKRELDFLTRFMTDPFGLLDEQEKRVTVEDAGDGTADILLDGKPVMGIGMQMKQVDGRWKIVLPVEYLQEFRPETREEWAVAAGLILSLDGALKDFENELDRGELRNLDQACRRAGRLLAERGFVQIYLYQAMKQHKDTADGGMKVGTSQPDSAS
ncbi:MAG TPA: hypothetical protein VG711_10825 [Phycisphaerales bacterium]|nr:hypothetical protein [Phycisphaerales bacterium]